MLLAEVDGELQAALTLTGAQELMEPYLPTAALVDLLALRAQHLRDQMTGAELAAAGSPIPVLAEWRICRGQRRGAPLQPPADAAEQSTGKSKLGGER